jgi:solute carrier family 66 (lysosomal lysine-arginine transporter), member 1
VSVPFLLLWLAGDICNLAGALWARLVPTVVVIAVYFCITDGVLLSQCGYYNVVNRKRGAFDAAEAGEAGKDGDVVSGDRGAPGVGNESASGASMEELGEEEPLLARQRSGSITIPGSARKGARRSTTGSATARRRSSVQRHDLLAQMLEEGAGNWSQLWIRNTLSVLVIVVVGSAGWAAAWGSGAWKPTPVPDGGDGPEQTGPVGAEILGYISAVAYLGARIPQIVKNAREKSCEGLSLLFFVLSLLGNLTYGAGIMFHSLDREYLVTNVPWLIGSLGTMVEDVVIFIQFHLYARNKNDEAII